MSDKNLSLIHRPLPPLGFSKSEIKKMLKKFEHESNPDGAMSNLLIYLSETLRLTEEQIENSIIHLEKPMVKNIYSDRINSIISKGSISIDDEISLLLIGYTRLLALGIGDVVTMESKGSEVKYTSIPPSAKVLLDAMKVKKEIDLISKDNAYETIEEMEDRYLRYLKKKKKKEKEKEK